VNDLEILPTALQWLEQGHKVALVTVVKTWGSSPRPVGSMLLMRHDGQHLGSVSGGCIEAEILERYRNGEFTSSIPTKLSYGVTSDQAQKFGLPCGGSLELVLENLTDSNWLTNVLTATKQSELICRQLNLADGSVNLFPATTDAKFTCTNEFIQQIFGPTWQLLLIGAGHLSHHVAQIGLLLDYEIIVCDPREQYNNSWQLPGTKLISIMPDDAVKQIAHKHGIVITLTHDPKLDDMALWEALKSPAFYIGALGSKRTNASRRQRLQQLGLTATQLARLHGPVGLAIGSHTPAEIAVAIMAELTAVRNGIYDYK